jgi:hypothetical protein
VQIISKATYDDYIINNSPNDEISFFVLEEFSLTQNVDHRPGVKLFGLPLIAATLQTRLIEIDEDSNEIFSSKLIGLKICISEEIPKDRLAELQKQIKWMNRVSQSFLN